MTHEITESGSNQKQYNRFRGVNDDERYIDTPSFDKGGHKERSLANSPNHSKHWQKVRRKTYETTMSGLWR